VECTEAKEPLPQQENLSLQELAQTLSQQGLSRREIARILFQEPYLALFRERLPRYPYATDDPRQGVRPRKRERALEYRYIQVGHYPHAIPRIVLDVDRPWPLVEDQLAAVPPSLAVVNPESGHLHVWYEIDPIPLLSPKSHEALTRTLRLLAQTEAELEAFLGADPAYSGLMARNPVQHPREWVWGEGKVWCLHDLREELRGLLPRGLRRAVRASEASYGRNTGLFHRLRGLAYAQVNLFRGKAGGEEAFRLWVGQTAHALNGELFAGHPKGPLDPREVGWIAKSVAKRTWAHYRGSRVFVSVTGRPDRSRLSRDLRALIPPLTGEALQSVRVANLEADNRRRREEAEEALVEALKRLQARGERITARALAREAGVKPHTASRWLKRMRGK
jgi:hypothetical protein